jgi:hypothetical protein
VKGSNLKSHATPENPMTGAGPGRKAEQMATGWKTTDRPRERSPWFEVVQFLFLIALAVAVLLLGQSMVGHRFFRGGYINQHGVLKP